MYQSTIDKVLRQLSLRRITKNNNGSFSKDWSIPFITISRDPGSGGKPIAKMTADRLRFRFYNESILKDIAKSAKLRQSVLKEIDEKSRDMITDFTHGLFNPEYVSDITYLQHLIKAILSVAYKGNVVILDHGSNFITPLESGLHVRIIAPYKVRLQRAIEYEGHPLDQAKTIIKEHERDRRQFVKQYFKKDINDLDYFDLIINTANLSIYDASVLIETAFKQKFNLD